MDRNIKRLIEVDLPIRRISEHARKEKNMRSGHPWHLHIWWARRPWGACRAVAFASLVPAPSDPNCPHDFLLKAPSILNRFGMCGVNETEPLKIEEALLAFTGELARFEAGNVQSWVRAARELVELAHPETPMAFDPFSGYGAIPAEAARLGCYSVASDLNPVAVLCLRVMLEAVPRHGQKLLELYEQGIEYIKSEAEKQLSQYYPKKEGRYPIAYLWARTVQCEGPDCGAIIPLITQTTLAKGKRKAWIEVSGNSSTKKVAVDIVSGEKIPSGLVKTAGGAHAMCPVCGTTNHKDRVKAQGNSGKMGNRLLGVALPIGDRAGKEYRNADAQDEHALNSAIIQWELLTQKGEADEIKEKYPYHDTRAFAPGQYGIQKWGDLFNARQMLSLHTLGQLLQAYKSNLTNAGVDRPLVRDVIAALALGVSNFVPYQNNLAYWGQDHMNYAYKGMGMSMKWDWAEASPLVKEYTGGIDYCYIQGRDALYSLLGAFNGQSVTVNLEDATSNSLPDDSADFFFSDPPYYDVVPYADLSDLCYVWLKRFLKTEHKDLFDHTLTPKGEQIVVNPYATADGRGDQGAESYRKRMTSAFTEAKRAMRPEGVGCVVFAHKGTTAWESLLASIVDAGFVVTASWPVDTERASRMRANDSAALQTSVHLVVRPRSGDSSSIGDWRDVLRDLPARIRAYMERMASEGVAGADAIFACLGPALEIYTRYSAVEKPNGDLVTLREYMEKVWEAVSQEALAMVFEDAATQGFEVDARVTAIWLWTLSSSNYSAAVQEEIDDEEDESERKPKPKGGFSLDSDTANRIAQSLGGDIRELDHIIEVKGEKSRLLSVRERIDDLFRAKERHRKVAPAKGTKNKGQLSLFDEWDEMNLSGETGEETLLEYDKGDSVLDRLHQAMLLFALGRTAMLRKFLAEDGVGRDDRFWKLAQALNALYPQGTEERRWLEGVQAYKKALSL